MPATWRWLRPLPSIRSAGELRAMRGVLVDKASVRGCAATAERSERARRQQHRDDGRVNRRCRSRSPPESAPVRSTWRLAHSLNRYRQQYRQWHQCRWGSARRCALRTVPLEQQVCIDASFQLDVRCGRVGQQAPRNQFALGFRTVVSPPTHSSVTRLFMAFISTKCTPSHTRSTRVQSSAYARSQFIGLSISAPSYRLRDGLSKTSEYLVLTVRKTQINWVYWSTSDLAALCLCESCSRNNARFRILLLQCRNLVVFGDVRETLSMNIAPDTSIDQSEKPPFEPLNEAAAYVDFAVASELGPVTVPK
jgi:hypothetical protein